MKLQFKDVIGKHKNIPAVICGHGPSLNFYKKKFVDLQNQGWIRYDCNDWFNFMSIPPTYWLFASTVDTIKSQQDKITAYNSTILYADSVDLMDRDKVDNILVNTFYLPYDQRHFKGMPCGENIIGCCKHIIPNRLTIQEELAKYSKTDILYGGYNAGCHMIAFALVMGCNPIYVAGIELDYKFGYASTIVRPTGYDLCREGCLEDFKKFNMIATALGSKIYQLNPNSTYNEFEFIKL